VVGFNSLVVLELLPDGIHARVQRELIYTARSGVVITVPIGFCTDGASIPVALWSTVGSPYTGKYRRAAILHDFMYHTPTLAKDDADSIFLEAMLLDGTDGLQAHAIWEGVHLFGRRAWISDHLVK
jgi:hypothetical protein